MPRLAASLFRPRHRGYPTDTALADFTPSAGSSYYALVAEAPDDDGDVSYVESGTVGHKDLYGYRDIDQEGNDAEFEGEHGRQDAK